MNIFIGYLILALFIIGIVAMICANIEMIKKDARKEAIEMAKHDARIMAEREYERMVRNTEFRIKQAVVISNESDIRW